LYLKITPRYTKPPKIGGKSHKDRALDMQERQIDSLNIHKYY